MLITVLASIACWAILLCLRRCLRKPFSARTHEGEFDPITGDLTDIHFIGEKLGDEKILFQALAPFVDKGSFIEMEGEDGDLWRWTFDGQQMIEQVARITWG